MTEHCDVETGTCGPVDSSAELGTLTSGEHAGELLYFTDPICSSCWVMEPAWRRLLHVYGGQLRIRYVYGGLLPSWDGYPIQPADLAQRLPAVAMRHGQPIDASVWLTDPVASSYPPSAAAHTVRLMQPDLEEAFLRRIRQELYLNARNIARTPVLAACAADVGLDAARFTQLYEAGAGQPGFERDLAEARQRGIRGFPTVVASGRRGGEKVFRGTQPWEELEAGLIATLGIERRAAVPTPADALAAYGSGTTREFAVLLNLGDLEAEEVLAASGATRVACAGSALWLHPESVSSR